jgi:hypothetical protein
VLTAMAQGEVTAEDTAAKHGSQKAIFNTLHTVCIYFPTCPPLIQALSSDDDLLLGFCTMYW